jgi:plasmanylethanolamine desaturase
MQGMQTLESENNLTLGSTEPTRLRTTRSSSASERASVDAHTNGVETASTAQDLTNEERAALTDYRPAHRYYELGCIAVGSISFAVLFGRALFASHALTWTSSLAIPLGFLFADLVSGFVHWAFDTYGSATTPFLGPLAIRTFREHHVAPKAMLDHDFVETNGHNIGLAIIMSALGNYLLRPLSATGDTVTASVLFCLVATVVVSMTSQVHKWAHADRGQVPTLVQWGQRLGVILRPEEHNRHHVAPHTTYYCIACGWMNPLLEAVRFFRMLEAVVSVLTWPFRKRTNA